MRRKVLDRLNSHPVSSFAALRIWLDTEYRKGAIERATSVTPSLRSRAGSEPIRFAQDKLREGSVAIGREILRCAQDDKAGPC